MSDYISKSAASEMLMDIEWENGTLTAAILMLNDIPTVDEKEIIRKAFERVVERLEEQKRKYERREEEHKDINTTVQLSDKYYGKWCSYKHAIEIVKEECGISE